jgi:hypothetical protein
MKPPMVSPYALLPPHSKARLEPKVKDIARLLVESHTNRLSGDASGHGSI